MENTNKITAKEAAQAAVKYLTELGISYPMSQITIEEVESEKDYWLITLGYGEINDKSSVISSYFSSVNKVYKIFKVDKVTGEVISMKIRQLTA